MHITPGPWVDQGGSINELATFGNVVPTGLETAWGPHGKLYGVSQGQWDGVGEGSRALPNTGRLVVTGRHGDLGPVVDRRGQELVLDRPASVEFFGDTAYARYAMAERLALTRLPIQVTTSSSGRRRPWSSRGGDHRG